MKKILIAMMVSAISVSMFASCGGSNNSSSGSSSMNEAVSEEATSSSNVISFDEDPYTVHFLYINMGNDVQRVQDAVDELAMKEINMHVELNALGWSSYYGTLSMLLAANEDLDLIEAFGQPVQTWIESGYLQSWEPYLDLIPDVTKDMGDDISACYYGDILAGIPNNNERVNGLGLIVRKDILEEVGFTEDDFSVDVNDLSTFDQLTDLFEAVHQAYPDMLVYGGKNTLAGQSTIDLDGLGNFYGVLDQETLKFYNYYESERFSGLCRLARDWFNAGYVSSDAAINENMGSLLMAAGNLFSYSTITKPNTAEEATSQVGLDTVVISCGDPLSTTSSVNGTMYCLSTASENPEKAAAAYNWMYTSAEFNDLINWGIEGTDWVEDENGQASYPDGVDSSSVGYHNDMGFGYPNQFIGHSWTGNSPTVWDDYKEWYESASKSVAFGAQFDSTEYTDQLSLCDAAVNQYMQGIGFGAYDVESTLDEFNNALYTAGLQDLIDAKQEQFDEWYTQNKS